MLYVSINTVFNTPIYIHTRWRACGLGVAAEVYPHPPPWFRLVYTFNQPLQYALY